MESMTCTLLGSPDRRNNLEAKQGNNMSCWRAWAAPYSEVGTAVLTGSEARQTNLLRMWGWTIARERLAPCIQMEKQTVETKLEPMSRVQ